MYDGRESLVFEMYNLLTIYLQFTYNLLTISQFVFYNTHNTHNNNTHGCFAAPMSVQCTHNGTYKMTCCFADNVCCLLNIVCIVLLLLLLLLHNVTYKMTSCFATQCLLSVEQYPIHCLSGDGGRPGGDHVRRRLQSLLHARQQEESQVPGLTGISGHRSCRDCRDCRDG